MRISDALISNIARQSLTRAQGALLKANQPVLDQTSLPTPSADLSKADRVGFLDRYDRELGRFDATRATVRNDLATAELQLDGLNDLIVDAQDLAVELGSDNISDEVRKGSAETARGFLTQLASLMNRRDASGKYQFAGLAEQTAPLDASFVYQGNQGVRMVEVAPGVSVAGTLSGVDVLGANNELVTALQSLASALEAGDGPGVRATLDELAASRERVSHTRSDVGGRISTLDGLSDVSMSLRTSTQIESGNLTGIDIAAVAPSVQSAQTMLEAVVSTSQQILARIGSAWNQ